MTRKLLELSSILLSIVMMWSVGAAAETILSVSPWDYFGWVVIFNGQGYTVGWTQRDVYDGVTISVNLSSGGGAGQTGRAYLTTRIGPGTSVSNEIASTSFTFPVDRSEVVLFQDLRLPPGSYYLSLIGDSPSWGSQWIVGRATNALTGYGVSSLGCFGSAGGNNYYPASQFFADRTVPPNIRVEGVDVSYPSLQIENTGNFALIRWSTNVFGFILEYTDDMNSTNWQTISQQPVRIDSYFVYPTSTVGAQFYRLRRQVE